MPVIPGTPSNRFSSNGPVDGAKNTFDTQIKGVDEASAVHFELEPGECSLHDSRIVHGATANTSPFRRCGYTMRYFSANIKVNEHIDRNGESFKNWLVHGQDLAGNRFANG